MTPSFDFNARQPSPQASSAAADLLVAAFQRTFTLQAEWMDQMIHRGLQQSRQSVAESIADPRALAIAATSREYQRSEAGSLRRRKPPPGSLARRRPRPWATSRR